MGERRCGRPLGARLDLEQLQCELLAFLGERPRRRRDPLALRERLLERREPFTPEPHPRLEVFALARRSPRRAVRLVRRTAELGRRRARGCLPRFHQFQIQLREQALRRLMTDAEPLRRTAQREQRVAAAARQLRLRLGAP